MGRPPAYIFVIRHGNRLDAADKQWHLSSPAPYDPPLTYGGWLQARALGARIGSILQERIWEDEAANYQESNPSKRRRRKYKVVLHSSPFLRCVQTSIAISAGLAQDPSPLQTSLSNWQPRGLSSVFGLPTNPGSTTDIANGAGEPETQLPRLHETRKSILRLDAFLGEWLSPGYFELITPPPESVMMLATAKADLLRREDYHSYPAFTSHHLHSNSQGQLWSGSPRASPMSVPSGGQTGALENLGAMSSSLPKSGSMSSHVNSGRLSLSQPAETGGYIAPVPHYAISSSATIPLGYVAHARDACVNIDYQWDSMRGPLEWGDGGAFGEEWTDMHRRFRQGIQNLVDWYSLSDDPTEMVTRTARCTTTIGSDDNTECAIEDTDDEDTEAVVVLVSHGAGCNALIGAITHQPVLMDVGMASLTMAVRKSGKELSTEEMDSNMGGLNEHASPNRITGVIPIHEYYDLRIFANTDHLRSPAPTPSSSRSSSIANVTSSLRDRFSNSFSSPLSNFSHVDSSGSRSSSANAALSNMRHPSGGSPTAAPPGTWVGPGSGVLGGGITIGSGVTSFVHNKITSGLARTPSIGLWSPVSRQSDEVTVDDDDDDTMVLNFSHEKIHRPMDYQPPAIVKTGASKPEDSATNGDKHLKDESLGALVSSPSAVSSNDKVDTVPQRGLGIGGLWGGGPRPPGEAERIRDLTSTKRRWTVNERAEGLMSGRS